MDFKEEYRNLLETVKNGRKKAGLPARNQDIAEILGYNRSYLSALIGEDGKVTADHLKDIRLHFPEMLGNITPIQNNAAMSLETTDNSTLLRILDNLSAAHKEISESNNKLADNEKLILMKMPTVGSHGDNPSNEYATLQGVRGLLIEFYADVKKTTLQEAESVLGKKVVDAKKKAGKKDILSDGGK